MEKVKEIAFRAAKTAGELLKQRLGNIQNIDYKSAFNIVTDVDRASEKEIIAIIRGAFPDDQILGEESGALVSASKRRWLIDPLDGTTNYTHGYPFFSVSIGFEDDGKRRFAAVFNPMTEELFWAERGKGAYLNDKPIKVSSNQKLSSCLLATGFPADTRGAKISNMAQFSTITDLCHGVRRDGSAALDLSFVACGRLDGFWELKLAQWDLAAGTLLVEEAGGKLSDLKGGPFQIATGHVVATNGQIHDELVNALQFTDDMLGFEPQEVAGNEKDVARM